MAARRSGGIDAGDLHDMMQKPSALRAARDDR
jgi:hypothetical protein